jgi:hypothetical protein
MSSDIHGMNTTQTKAIKDNSAVISEFINGDIDNSDKTKNTQRRAPSKHAFPRQEIIDALSKLQPTYKSEYIAGQKNNINTDGFKSALLNSVAKMNPTAATRSVNQIDGRTIDFVEMLFGAFLRDINISTAIKSVLLSLQIPVIKIAMLDTKFFYNNKHPARNVLDQIAHIGIGIDSREDPVLKTMNLIIEQLLNSFDKNIVSFHTALKALNRLEIIEQGKQDENEKQTRQRILKEHARQFVLTELQHQVGKKELPKAIQPLVLKYWSTLMFHRFIRHGKNSSQWNIAVDLLSRIIRSCSPAKTHGEMIRLTDSQDDLINQLAQPLSEIKLEKEKIFTALKALKITMQKTITISENTLADKGIEDEADDFVEETKAHPTEAKAKLAKEKINRLPESVKPGAWFEIYTGENTSIRRLKLSVIVQEEARLVFVNRLGMKVIDKDADIFAKELEEKKSLFIADHSIFNNALSNVIMSLSAQS